MSFKLQPDVLAALPLELPDGGDRVARHSCGRKVAPGGVIQPRRGDELGEVVELLAVLALVVGVRPVALGLGVGIRAEIIVSTESMNPITLALNTGLVVSEKGSPDTKLSPPSSSAAMLSTVTHC